MVANDPCQQETTRLAMKRSSYIQFFSKSNYQQF